MASSHIMSLSRNSRSEASTKSPALRSVNRSDVNKNSYIQSSLLTVADFSFERQIIEQFRLHREIANNISSTDEFDEKAVRRRKFYIKKHKLRAVIYSTTTWKKKKNETMNLISKYIAAKNLEIITAMLRKWIKSKSDIETMHNETRKNRIANNICQKPAMKARVIELFKQKREAKRRIFRQWFICQAKRIYDDLYSHRVINEIEKRTEYIAFKFSFEWFRNFKKRAEISLRIAIKKTQKIRFRFFKKIHEIHVDFIQISEDLRQNIINWLKFNRRNSQSLSEQISLHEDERYRLCDIDNMNQTFIDYEFLEDQCYDFKKFKTVWMKTHREDWDKR